MRILRDRTRLEPASVLIVGLWIGLAAPANGWASGFDVFGMGARGSAMSSASVSNAEDYSALYYNPAGMVLRSSTAGFGVFVSFDNAEINLAPRPAGYDLPNLGRNSPGIPSEFRLRERTNTEGLDSLVGVFVGATTTFGLENLRLGVAALVPVGDEEGAGSVYNDEREQYFTNQLHFDLLGNRIHHTVILFGAAYRVLSWLSLGAGLSFMPSASTNNGVLIPNITDQSDVEINVTTELPQRWRPLFGVLVFPEGPFRGGVAFRDEQLFGLTGRTEIQLRGFQEEEDFPVFQNFDITLQYSPRQIIWGGSWLTDGWLLSADVIYSLWSDFRDNHSVGVDFSDTFSPRFGAELKLGETDRLRLGAAYEPTPVPPQTGRSNFVDNARLVASVGMEHRVSIWWARLRIGWQIQLHYLVPREHIKSRRESYPICEDGVTALCDEVPNNSVNPATGEVWAEAAGLQTGNPGFPGFSSGGWIGAAGVEVSWDF